MKNIYLKVYLKCPHLTYKQVLYILEYYQTIILSGFIIPYHFYQKKYFTGILFSLDNCKKMYG